MEICINCGKETEYEIRVLEVQTLHIRDWSGERKVQALGDFRKYAVCADCAEEKLKKTMDFGRSVLSGCISFGFILLLGIALAVCFWTEGGPLRLLGLAAAVCGVLGTYATLQNGLERRKYYKAHSREEAFWQSAWELLLEKAPKKSEDSDLTYIPVTSKTLSMKNGDLMIHYGLLPEIAIKAYELIHKEKK